MLKTLSIRNAKRQAKNYLIYFITLMVAASLIFGLNSLIFSKDIVFTLENTKAMRYIIGISSVIIVLILAWLIRYMMNFMLKKRSKELSIYMILGIENRSIIRMFLTENLLIGGIALFFGYLGGTFVFYVLKAIVMNLIGIEYSLSFDFSVQAIALTALYFILMYALSAFRSRRTIKKLALRDLLYYEQQNESTGITKNWVAVLVFILSLLCFAAAILLFVKEPLGEGMNFPVGILFIAVFIYCFFTSLPRFVITVLLAGTWRYKGNRIIILRNFTSKLGSMSKTMAFLSVALTISLLLITNGMIAVATYNYRVSLVPFDFSIISENGIANLQEYQNYVNENFDVLEEYVYSIYQSDSSEFTDLNFGFTSYSYMPINSGGFDLCMTYRDYSQLREILGLTPVSLDNNGFIIHSLSYFYDDIEKHSGSNMHIELNGYGLNLMGIYTENFDQYDGFSNGRFFILVVPDYVVSEMDIKYIKYSVMTDNPASYTQYEKLLNEFDTLKSLRSKSGYSNNTGQLEYLDVKMDIQKSNGLLYSTEVLPIWYMALILCIAGVTVLSNNILSEETQHKKQFSLLRSIGYSTRTLDIIILLQLATLFVVPVIPSVILVAFLAPVYTKSFGADVFVPSSELWCNILLVFAIYLLIYLIYYFASYILKRKSTL